MKKINLFEFYSNTVLCETIQGDPQKRAHKYCNAGTPCMGLPIYFPENYNPYVERFLISFCEFYTRFHRNRLISSLSLLILVYPCIFKLKVA